LGHDFQRVLSKSDDRTAAGARHSRAATKNAKADGQMKSPEKRPHLPVMFTAWPDR
jgi:hypothetical protein